MQIDGTGSNETRIRTLDGREETVQKGVVKINEHSQGQAAK